MQNSSLRHWLQRVGVIGTRPTKRAVKLRSGWGIEAEELENRALLSAANQSALAENPVAAEVASAAKKAPVQFPNVAGTYNLTLTGKYAGTGTVTMTQDGAKVTSVVNVDVAGLDSFTTTATFKKRSPNVLTSKSPRMDLPGSPIPLKLTIQITFPSGNLNPTTFTGAVKVPFFGTASNLAGTKLVQQSSVIKAESLKKAPPPAIGGPWQLTVSNIPEVGSVTGPLTLVQHGRRITGSADLGNGATLKIRAKIDRADPTVLSGKASVTGSQLGLKNAPFDVTLDTNNTHFAGSADAGAITLHLEGFAVLAEPLA